MICCWPGVLVRLLRVRICGLQISGRLQGSSCSMFSASKVSSLGSHERYPSSVIHAHRHYITLSLPSISRARLAAFMPWALSRIFAHLAFPPSLSISRCIALHPALSVPFPDTNLWGM